MSVEQTPLIQAQNDSPAQYDAISESAAEPTKKETPLPKMQLFAMLLIQFCEPVTGTVVYPFVVSLVNETGITGGDQTKTGYFAGIIESVFFASEALTAFAWGRASDHIGRKPPLVFGMLALAAAISSFGLSNKFWPLVISRCVQGIMNGNIGISKSVLVDMTDSTNMARAFSFIPLSWGTGVILGPLIGGVLSHPAEQWPSTFGKIAFLRQYPYVLPCFTAGLLPLGASVFTALFFKETLPSAKASKKHRATQRDQTLSTDDDVTSTPAAPENQAPPPVRALMTRRVIVALLNYAFLAWTEQAIGVLMTLMYPTPVHYGGLGLSSFAIGVIMSCLGLFIGISSVVIFPWALARYSATQVYRACYSGYLVTPFLFPLMNFLARRHGVADGPVWAVLVLQVLCGTLSCQCFSSVFILLTEAAPTQSSLGAINGLAQTVACTMRIFAPFTASSLFSLSQEKNLLGGTLVFWLLELVIIAGVIVSFRLEEPPKVVED